MAGGGAEGNDDLVLLDGKAGEAAIVGAVHGLLGLALGQLEEGEGGGVEAADVVRHNAVTR